MVKKMDYRVLAIDLDGTLTNSRKQITSYTREILRAAMDRGIKIILASGRPVLGIRNIAEELELKQFGGYILAYNGGQIIDCHHEKVIFEKLIPNRFYTEICRIARSFGVQPLTYLGSEVLAESEEDPYVRREAYNNSTTIKKVGRVDHAVKQQVPKFMLVGENDRLKMAQECIKKTFLDKLDVFFSEPYFLEVVPAGIEKAKALEILLFKLSLFPENLMAFGDGMNDIPMLLYAGYSVAMENACQRVKEVADFITVSNDEDGVAKVVKTLLLDGKNHSGGRDESINCNCNI